MVFAEATQTVFLADMSGDGLVDLVRIRNGEVCYWPNLGHGRFGAKVTMARAPVFDRPNLFDPKRLRLVDVDGTGTTDFIYLGSDGVRVWMNGAGNTWSDARGIPGIPIVDARCAFLGRILLDDIVEQTTEVGGVGRTSFRSRHVFSRAGETMARGELVHVCVDRETRETVPVPGWLRERAVTDEV